MRPTGNALPAPPRASTRSDPAQPVGSALGRHSRAAARDPTDLRPNSAVAVYAEAPAVAHGLGELLAANRSITVVCTHTYPADLLASVRTAWPRVVIVCAVSDSRPAAQLVADLRALPRSTGRELDVVRVVRPRHGSLGQPCDAGASAVLTSHDRPAALIDAVLAVLRGTAEHSGAGARRAELNASPAGRPLTSRELEVLDALVGGLSASDIATELGMSVNTARTHVQRILRKLGAHTRRRAAAVALEHGLVTPR